MTNRRPSVLCPCGRETRDQAPTCDSCIQELEIALTSVPFIVNELDTTLTRLRAAPIAGGRRGAGPRDTAAIAIASQVSSPADTTTPVDLGKIAGLPWRESAARARRHIQRTLIVWALYCQRTGIHPTHRITPPGIPWAMTRREHKALQCLTDLPAEHDIAGLARWLSARIERLRLHPEGHHAARDLVRAIADARAVVFYKRKARIYLGRCDLVRVYKTDTEPCDGDVYADADADIGTCEECGRDVTVVVRQAHLEQLLDDTLCTASEIASCAVYLGLPATRDRVANLVAVWKKRGRIMVKGGTAAEPKYRYGDVVPLLYATYTKRTG